MKLISLQKKDFKVSGLIIALVCSLHTSTAQNGWTKYLNSPNAISISALAIDNNGKKLLATSSNGLIMTLDGISYDTLRMNNSGLITNTLIDVAVDANNHYWIATLNLGLIKYDGTSWTNFNTNNSNIISNEIKKVFCVNNKIYVGSYAGFSILEGNLFTNYSVSNSNLVNDSIYSFAIDNNDKIYIATKSGLSIFDGFNFTNLDISNSGLTDNVIYSLYFDGQDIWIGTKSKSIFRYTILNGQIKSIKEIFDTPIVFTSPGFGSYPILSICTGPHGGVVFANYMDRMYEIFQNKIYTYYNSNSTLSNTTILAYDNQSHLVYCYGGIYNKLTSFNFVNYNGYANSNTFDNYKSLDINNVNAAITNRGDMFWDVDIQKPNFVIPKGSGKTSIFSNSLWIAGLDNGGTIHSGAQTYRQRGVDFWTGPLDTISGNTDTLTVIDFDKIWKINWFDIEQFKYFYEIGAVQNGSWSPSLDIITWPASGSGNYTRNMAPFIDVNHNGIYDPIQDGDYPDIKGDQMLYWIFNDNLGPHAETKGLALKVEVHASAYAFSCPDISNADSSINYTTFYNYKIFNRSNVDYNSCFIGNFTDFELGWYDDDATGCNPLNNMSYCYNYDIIDGSGLGNSYGLNPPAIANVILNGPTALPFDSIDNDNDGTIDELNEKNLMNSCIFYANSLGSAPINGYPDSTKHFYNLLKGLWKDGSDLTFGGNGIGGITPTKFMFSDSTWYPTFQYDMQSIQSTGPFSFPANSSIDYDFAIVYARDTVGNNSPQLFQQLFDNAARAKTWFDHNTFPSCVGPNSIIENIKRKSTLELFPNPADDIINFRSSPGHPVKEIRIYNALGKEVYFNPIVNTNEIFVGSKAPGIYLLSLKYEDGSISTNKFIKQ